VEAGDAVLGLASSGVHSNGYSLVRRILESGRLTTHDRFPLSERTVGEDLLEPTRIYVKSVLRLLEAEVPIRAMAHVTGGGLAGNLGRVIPAGLSARLRLDSWKVPRLFRTLQELGSVSDAEMHRTFNMGVGYVLVVARDSARHATQLLEQAGETVVQLGRVVRGDERVSLEGQA
jgi:phosphoribosylformylglycinamidine cyclo-ligase